jgi:SAM-dependent methyltransferase
VKMPTETQNTNLIQSEQWDAAWGATRPPRPLRPWRNYLSWMFAQVFKSNIPQGARILEVGCGGSKWLPYFAKTFGAEVWGLDWSPNGVASARAALRAVGEDGKIVLGDLFTTTDVPCGYFDVVWSGGFIEHFTNTSAAIKAISRFAKPDGGLVITEVPNMGGFLGRLHQRAHPDFYAQHVVLSPELMDSLHREAGLQPKSPAQYFGTLNLGVINYERVFGDKKRSLAVFMRALDVAQTLMTLPLWLLRTSFETAALSPFVLGLYKRRCDG